jgi:hypothetical protein
MVIELRRGAQLVEMLHLALLQVLPSYLPQTDYVLKGGANLRLFYDSPRRSQDIDFDYIGRRSDVLEAKIDEALAARGFREILRVAGVSMSEPTKPKQTPTTRRWKFGVSGPSAFINTKIEFSTRTADPERAFEAAPRDIGREIGLRVVKANHYLPPAAIRQKVSALAHRQHTEPRDVFDLDLLFAKHPNALRSGDLDSETLTKAAEAALAISYDAYKDLVVEFIEDDFVDPYRRSEVWVDMVLNVVEHLEGLK